MVTLFCAIAGEERPAFPVDIEASKSVGHLKEAIWEKNKRRIQCDPPELVLFLAMKGDAWLDKTDTAAVTLDEERRAVVQDENGSRRPLEMMDETLDVVYYFGTNLYAKTRTNPRVGGGSANQLTVDMWQIGGIALSIRHVEPDFLEWFYVRKETLDIIKIFSEHIKQKLNTVFVGTNGVGKSMLVVLFAFYMAFRQQKRVVLFRKRKGKGLSLLYLDAENQRYWRKEEAGISDLDLVENRDFELCLDGFTKDDIDANFERLARFRLLATPVQYRTNNDDTPVVGAHFQWTEHEIKERYFYSGGNLRDFLSEKNVVIDSIDQAIGLVDIQVAKLLNTQFALGSDQQIDRLRMTSIQASEQDLKNHSCLTRYKMTRSWFCIITSEYALRQLGKIVKPSYYKELWSKGRMLGDDGLMGIAFENYVHTMARDGKKIELHVRAHDRKKTNQHTYAAVEFKAKSRRNEGRDAAECEAIMQQLTRVDYWYPFNRCLVTIDSVAKLDMGGEQGVVGLIQITKSDNHKIDSMALNKYAKLFPDGARYIALVPDKETSDKFRLDPVDPPTQVPLHMAYIAAWNL